MTWAVRPMMTERTWNITTAVPASPTAFVRIDFGQDEALASALIGGWNRAWLTTDGADASGCWQASIAAPIAVDSLDWGVYAFDLVTLPSVATLTWSYRAAALAGTSLGIAIGVIKPDLTTAVLSSVNVVASSALWTEVSNVNILGTLNASGTYSLRLHADSPIGTSNVDVRFDRIRIHTE